jgi:hypothetical protein
LTNDPNFNSFRRGCKILPVFQKLLQTTGINLDNGAGIPKLIRFQEHLTEYRIVVYAGLNCDQIMYDGEVDSSTRINLLYDDVTRHYHVINTLTGAMQRSSYVKRAMTVVTEK